MPPLLCARVETELGVQCAATSHASRETVVSNKGCVATVVARDTSRGYVSGMLIPSARQPRTWELPNALSHNYVYCDSDDDPEGWNDCLSVDA